jgi:hypothetical protein
VLGAGTEAGLAASIDSATHGSITSARVNTVGCLVEHSPGPWLTMPSSMPLLPEGLKVSSGPPLSP